MRSLVYRLMLLGLLLLAVALTAVRILQPDSGIAVRLVSFAPVAVALYGAAVLLLVARWLLPGSSAGRVRLALLVVAVAGLGVHLWWLSPQFSGDPPAAREGESFRVMTVNLLEGGAEASEVVESAAEKRVEVLVLQEITPTALRELERYGIDQAYPYRAGVPAEGTQGTMVFATYRIRNATQLDTRFDSWAADIVRPAGMLRLYGVHVKPPLTGAGEWRADLEELADLARDDEELDLVVGDLNATHDHRELRAFEDAGFRSAAEVANAGWLPTWPDQWKYDVLGVPLPRLVQIDHVLVGRSMTAVDAETVELKGSDHRAVVAEVALRR